MFGGPNFTLLGPGQNVQMSEYPDPQMIRGVGWMVHTRIDLIDLYDQSDRFSQITPQTSTCANFGC